MTEHIKGAKVKSLKEKQAEQKKHYADQKLMELAPRITIEDNRSRKAYRRNGKLIQPMQKVGRPPSGYSELRIWISPQARAWLEMVEQNSAIKPGVAVEMLISLTQGSAAVWQSGKQS